MNATEIIMRSISGLVFALLGYFTAHKIPRESKITAPVLFVVAVLLSSDVLRNVIIFAVDQYAIYLNSSLYGLSIGILMAFLVKGKFKPPGTGVQNHP